MNTLLIILWACMPLKDSHISREGDIVPCPTKPLITHATYGYAEGRIADYPWDAVRARPTEPGHWVLERKPYKKWSADQ